MNVGAIGSIQSIAKVAAEAPAAKAAGAPGDFASSIARAVEVLDGVQQSAGEQATKLAAGESVDLHDVMIAQEWASLSLDLAVQVRNKLVEAYQEVMRMQV
jgi:flagellar hook-basal body complex protein FliE